MSRVITSMLQITFAVITICMLLLTSCSNPNPIYDVQPADTTYRTGFPLEEFKALGERGDTTAQKALVEKHRKLLTQNILKQHPNIQSEKNIKFLLGSGFAKDVKSGDGKTYSGEFKNELIIILNDHSIRDTLFLACGNGMLQPLELKHSSHCGNGSNFIITIRKGESLAKYFPKFKEWGRKASECGIIIRDDKGNPVDDETYQKKPANYYSFLFPGDRINLFSLAVTDENHKRVNFKRRQIETFKTNIQETDRAIQQINKQLQSKKLSKKERSRLLQERKKLAVKLENLKKTYKSFQNTNH